MEERFKLIKPQSVSFLLNRGKKATQKWTPDKQFEEKQDDTADILIIEKDFFNIIDVKTTNAMKEGQPPNIISALKLANMSALMIDNNEFNTHDITYVGLTWELEAEELKCKEVFIKELFKFNPSDLYINWAAALS